MERPIGTALLIALALAETAAAGPDRVQDGRLAELAFTPGSAALAGTRAETLQLDAIAAWLDDNPDGLIVVSGHADREGDRAANVRLSLARAQAVRDRLVAAGINPDQIVIATYGEAGARRRVVVWGTRDEMADHRR